MIFSRGKDGRQGRVVGKGWMGVRDSGEEVREQCEGFQAWQWLWRVVGTGEQTGVHSAKQSAGKGAARLKAKGCGSDSKATATLVPLVSGSAGLSRLRFLYSQVATTLPAALLRVRAQGLGRSQGVRGARCALG